MTVKKLNSQTLYEGRAFDVRRDEVEFPSGYKTTYDIVVHIGAVAIVPIEADGQIVFVRQYRHSTGKHLLELPAGTLSEGEAAESCAQRELREEIGMAPGLLEKLGEFFLAPGYSTERMYIFLARDLTPEKLEGDEDEDLELVRMSPKDAFAAVASGKIEDAKTIAGLFLAKGQLGWQ